MNSPLILAAVSLALGSFSSGQNLLYFNNLNDEAGSSLGIFSAIDSASHGTSVGSASVISNTTDTTPSVPSFFASPSPASPAGGNYIIGPANGQGNVRDFDFNLFQVMDGNGLAPTFVDGADYEIVFWTKPTLFTETVDGEQWAYIPSETTYTFITGPTEQSTFEVSGWSPSYWTEVRIPVAYDAATTVLSDNITVVAPAVGVLTQVGGTGGTPPFLLQTNTRLWQIDYGLVPEPSSSLLFATLALLGIFRRSR